MKRLIANLILLFLLLAADYPARVVGVTDGDSIIVMTAWKKRVKIYLLSIDSPKNGQEFGQRAKLGALELGFHLPRTRI